MLKFDQEYKSLAFSSEPHVRGDATHVRFLLLLYFLITNERPVVLLKYCISFVHGVDI